MYIRTPAAKITFVMIVTHKKMRRAQLKVTTHPELDLSAQRNQRLIGVVKQHACAKPHCIVACFNAVQAVLLNEKTINHHFFYSLPTATSVSVTDFFCFFSFFISSISSRNSFNAAVSSATSARSFCVSTRSSRKQRRIFWPSAVKAVRVGNCSAQNA